MAPFFVVAYLLQIVS